MIYQRINKLQNCSETILYVQLYGTRPCLQIVWDIHIFCTFSTMEPDPVCRWYGTFIYSVRSALWNQTLSADSMGHSHILYVQHYGTRPCLQMVWDIHIFCTFSSMEPDPVCRWYRTFIYLYVQLYGTRPCLQMVWDIHIFCTFSSMEPDPECRWYGTFTYFVRSALWNQTLSADGMGHSYILYAQHYGARPRVQMVWDIHIFCTFSSMEPDPVCRWYGTFIYSVRSALWSQTQSADGMGHSHILYVQLYGTRPCLQMVWDIHIFCTLSTMEPDPVCR